MQPLYTFCWTAGHETRLRVVLLLVISSTGAFGAEVVARYDAGLAGGPAPVSPSNYVFNAISWTPTIVAATGITNSPVTNDLASGFNAWNTSDNATISGSVNFAYPVSNSLDPVVSLVGWHLRARVRMASSFGSTDSCFVEYGTGASNPRFLIFFGLNGSSNLTANLQGLTTLTLTTNGQGAAAYHLHEIVSSNGTTASYYFDGQLITNGWNGFVTPSSADGVRFGTGSTSGKGSMNYNLVEWEINTTKPSVTTLAATNLAAYAATLSGNLDLDGVPAAAWFQWGATTNYGNTTSAVSFGVGSNAFNFYQSIAGLSPSNTYHFRCVASNALGTNFGQDATFVTPMLFSATTLPVTNLEPRRATLAGAISPSGLAASMWFEWGTTTNYGNTTALQSAGGGTGVTNLFQLITGLATNTTYHYRCAASNAQHIVFGQDVVFTTPPVFTVTSLLNSGPGSLRQSISNAIGGDTITFGTTGTVILASELLISKSLRILGPGPSLITVSGNNATRVFTITNGVTVDISGLRIGNGRTAAGADSTGTNNPADKGLSGGGIFNRGTLNLSNCVITANATGAGGEGASPGEKGSTSLTGGGDGGDGGGIYNVGTLTLVACTVSGNTAGTGGIGGGRISGPGGSGGDGADGGAGGNGGGMYNSGVATLTASTLSGNSSGTGGAGGRGSGSGSVGGRGGMGGHGSAIYNVGTLSVVGSTASGQATGRGGTAGIGPSNGTGGAGGNGGSGTIYSSGPFALVASTVSSNSAGNGGNGGNAGIGGDGGNGGEAGGVLNAGLGSAGSLRNTLIAANTSGLGGAGGTAGGNFGLAGFGPDLKGTFTTEGHNLIGKNDGNASFIIAPGATGDQIGSLVFPINPLLGSLAHRGGPTFTMSLLAGSPARDAGEDSLAGLLPVDQRGYPRLSGSHVDIGAFEVQWVPTNNRPLLKNPLKLGDGTFQFTFTNVPGAEFTVLTSTNVALPLNSWTVLGSVAEIAPGQFQVTDSTFAGATNRFYLIRWP